MAVCERTDACPIYNYFKTEALKNYYIRTYCEGNFSACLRKKMKSEGKEVPDTLLPDGKELTAFHGKK